jgi:hypothetical protein
MEEPFLLMPVQRVVGGIEIENDLRRRRLVRRKEQRDEQPLNRRRIMGDLVITRRLLAAQLEPVECRFAGRWRTVLRRAASLPTSTAITGSCRSSS